MNLFLRSIPWCLSPSAKPRARLAALLGIVLLSFPFSAFSASVITMPLAELTVSADDVVVARCVTQQSRWQGDKIFTDTTLEVLQTIKGEPRSHLVLTYLGGTAMHPRLNTPVSMSVPGGVQFSVGEEVLVFSKKSLSGVNQLVGLTQGKFLIETDPDTGLRVIPVGQKILTDKSSVSDELNELFSPSSNLHDEGTKIRMRKIRLDELLGQVGAYVEE